MFSADECRVLLEAVETDPALGSNVMQMQDAEARVSALSLWNTVGEHDTFANFARSRRWVGAAARLINTEPYHFHTKVPSPRAREFTAHKSSLVTVPV